MSQNHTCKRCDRTVDDKHNLCQVCRQSFTGGNDDDDLGPSPGVATATSPGPSMNLAPSAEPTHRVQPATVAP